MGVPLQTQILFPSKNATLLSGATIHYHYKDRRAPYVVSIAVNSLAIWTNESRHYSSFDCLTLILRIVRQCRCSQITLDLFAELREAVNAASLLIRCKYLVLSNLSFLFAMADSREESCWEFLVIIAQSVWALLECLACLTPSL